jgi:ribosome maturation factor RimP
VSSPGLDRKLYSVEDYEQHVGHRVRIRMAPSYREHRTVIGELLGTHQEKVRVFDDSGQEIRLPIDEIFEARLEVDWNSIMKEGKRRS